MKKAVLYARVSSDVQKKERTIESQITELKSQIKEGGAVLVKEYVDDGYSGARLDRPALEELRRFVKTPLFDSIYFLNTDRIARDVTYQIIIISNSQAAEAAHHQWPRLRREPGKQIHADSVRRRRRARKGQDHRALYARQAA